MTSRCTSSILYVLRYLVSGTEQVLPSFISVDDTTNEIVINTASETDVGTYTLKLRGREGPISATFYRYVELPITLTVVSSTPTPVDPPPDDNETDTSVVVSPPYFTKALTN